MPANAAIRIQAFDTDLDHYVAMVDAEVADFVEVPELRIDYLITSAFAISIAGVNAGAHVRVQWCPEIVECVDLIEYDASEPVVELPPAPSSMIFDLHDFPGGYGASFACELYEELAWWIKTEVTPSDGDIEVFHLFEGYTADSRRQLLFRLHGAADGDSVEVHVGGMHVQLGDTAPPEAVCIVAVAIDAAGNRSESLESCMPCRHSVEPAMFGEAYPTAEPSWTDADIHPGGSCVDGVPPIWEPEPEASDETGAGTTDDGGTSGGQSTGTHDAASEGGDGTGGAPATPTRSEGCQVSTMPRENPRWLALLIVVFGFARRRR